MSPTFMICVRDIPHGKVLVKIGVMEFGLYSLTILLETQLISDFIAITLCMLVCL